MWFEELTDDNGFVLFLGKSVFVVVLCGSIRGCKFDRSARKCFGRVVPHRHRQSHPPQSAQPSQTNAEAIKKIVGGKVLPLLETVGAMKPLTWVDLDTAATTERAR